jgi:hypothetical protein
MASWSANGVTGVTRSTPECFTERGAVSKISYSESLFQLRPKAATMTANQLQTETKMRPRHLRAGIVQWSLVVLALMVTGMPGLRAQEASPLRHVGAVQDWSSGTVIFSRDGLAKHPELMKREPRVFNQVMQRWQTPQADLFRGFDGAANGQGMTGKRRRPPKRDWNVPILGGRLAANMYPSKFSFDPAADPDCTNDYVVFGLNNVGSTANGNLLAFNNLYVDGAGDGFCTGLTAPTVLFDYNITTVATGRIDTSPILSLDGKKVAFIESVPGTGASTTFHVLTWKAGDGSLTTSVIPTPAQMKTLTISAASDDHTSSPWIDYENDVVYVGTDDGVIHKITGVFNGTPTLAGSPWPVTVSSNYELTPPVLDSARGVLMVGSQNGTLYQINTATGAVGLLPIGVGGTNGIVAPPIVDVTNGTTFAVTADDGTSGVLVEVDTVALTELSFARIGVASHSGTAVHLYQPAFSNDYFTDPSLGTVRVCGTGSGDLTPWQYAFGFTGRTMIGTTPTFSKQLLASTTSRCTGWTEFFNPNVGSTGTDYFFFGLTQDCSGGSAGNPADGCVAELTNAAPGSLVTSTIDGGTSGIVIDNYSTQAQAASIYFCARLASTAYKFTQAGLQ